MDDLMFYRKNSILANLCKEWDNRLRSCHNNKEKLMQLVLSRQAAPHFATFCYNGAGLTKEYCLREFGEYVNGMKFYDVDGVDGYASNMYVDAKHAIVVDADTTQLLWCNNTEVEVPSSKCPVLYLSNKSNVNLVLNGYNSPIVYLFDESVLNVYDADETCKVTVYKYSDKAKAEKGKFCLGEVKVFNKELRL